MSGPPGPTALIGHTGFVGSNILRQREFDDVYNSTNIHEIAGRRYSLVVSAAGRADAHRINEEPERDLAELLAFADVLATASIDMLVHVSTVCVYGPRPRVDEDVWSDPVDLMPYGRNRLVLEQRLADRFDTLRLRLPQLFGPGIKKGLVYDLAKDYRIEFIQPDDSFQYYDLTRLADDIDIALDAGLRVLNVATEPIVHRRLAETVFGIELGQPDAAAPPSRYTRDMLTKHADVFGRHGDYLADAGDVMEAIRRFVDDMPDRGDRHARSKIGDR